MPETVMKNYSFMSKFKKYVSSSVVLIVCTVLALICANVPALKDWYFSLWQHPMAVSVGEFNLFSHGGHPMNVMMVINDFLMAIFFLSVGLEIKREILVGDDEGDIVMRTYDMRDKRVHEIVAKRLAAHALHSCHPQLHIVLLLLAQHISQLIGVD